jgi:hypothetical protein
LLFFTRLKPQKTDGLLHALMDSRQNGQFFNLAEVAAQPMQGRCEGGHVRALL